MSGVAKAMSVELPSWKYSPNEVGERDELVPLVELRFDGVLFNEGIPQIDAGRRGDTTDVSIEFFEVPGVEVAEI